MITFGRVWALIIMIIAVTTATSRASMIRDTEIEDHLLALARPMATAAGMDADQLQIRIIISPTYNAFVTGENTIFVHSGLVIEAESIYEVAGVLAHEIGHLASGHVQGRGEVVDNAMMASVFGAVAALALSASGHGDAAVGAVLGSTDQTQRIILKQSRQDESEADEWAIRLMQDQGYSLRPMANLMARLSKQRLLPESRQSKYYQTHPGARERSVVFLNHALSEPASDQPPPADINAQFHHIKAKLQAWTDPPEQTLINTNPDIPSDRFRLAIAAFRLSDLKEALNHVDQLIAANPDQPFYREFKGEILLSAGRAQEAVDAFHAALERLNHDTNKGQIFLSLGRALMTMGDQDSLNKAIPYLEEANRLEPEWAFVKHQLGITYGRAGRLTDADLVLAERAIMIGNYPLAKQLAERARDRENSNPIQRQLALDLIIEAEQ